MNVLECWYKKVNNTLIGSVAHFLLHFHLKNNHEQPYSTWISAYLIQKDENEAYIPLRPGILHSVDLCDITQNRILTPTDSYARHS